jgi:hypothetical protein
MWAYARNVQYPNFSPNNCANYVSQMLDAGGYPQVFGNLQDPTKWGHKWDEPWHQGNYGHLWTNSWSVVNTMNNYAYSYPAEFELLGMDIAAVRRLQAGDFYLMRLPNTVGSGPGHARVVVGMGNPILSSCSNPSNCVCPAGEAICLLSNQHTVDRYRVPVGAEYDNTIPLWAWHVKY